MGLRKSFAGWIYPEQAQGRERANPVGNVISTPLERIAGVGEDWAQESYGEQMAQSVPVYSAVRLLASSVSSVPPKSVPQVKGRPLSRRILAFRLLFIR